MWKSLFFLVLFLSGTNMLAQNCESARIHRPLLAEGKQWLYEGSVWNDRWGYSIYDTTYELRGDTVIDGQSYQKLYRHCHSFEKLNSPVGIVGDTITYHSAWREAGNRVLKVLAGQESEVLAFDFGMDIGEELPGQEGCHLSSVDLIELKHDGMATVYTRLNFTDSTGKPAGAYIDGIGGINGLLDGQLQWGHEGVEGYTEFFEECRLNNHKLISYTDFEAKAIDGIADIILHQDGMCAFYDLQGRRLTDLPRKGIYVRGGRKYVVK